MQVRVVYTPASAHPSILPSIHPYCYRHPHLYMLMPWGEQFDLTMATCRERSEDMRTLNHGIVVAGITMQFGNSVLMGDTPVLQIAMGDKIGGNHACTASGDCLKKVCGSGYNPTATLALQQAATLCITSCNHM